MPGVKFTAFEVYYDQLKKDFPELNVGCFIKKPVEIDNLVEKIREELQSELSSNNTASR